MAIDVRRLALLREVAVRGSIRAAADSLGYTRSAVSQQLGQLEREVNAELLERGRRGVELTAVGQLLADHATKVLAALEDATAALEDWRSGLFGSLIVSASGTVSMHVAIPAVHALTLEHPEVDAKVLELADQREALILGDIDVIVSHEYDHEPRPIDAAMVRVELFQEPMVVVAPAGRIGPDVSLADLRKEAWAGEPEQSVCGRALRTACRAVGFEPNMRYLSTETSVVLQAIATTGAMSFLPASTLRSAPPGVVGVPVTDFSTRRNVYALHRPSDPVRPTVRALIEHLRRRATEITTPG